MAVPVAAMSRGRAWGLPWKFSLRHCKDRVSREGVDAFGGEFSIVSIFKDTGEGKLHL